MKEIFEQFQFIPKMLDTSSHKVQLCSIWSMAGSLIIWLAGILTHFTVNIVGMSKLYAVLLFFVMLADFYTGIRASKKEWTDEHPGEKWRSESKKGLRWVIKYITYIAGFFILNVISMEVATIHIGSLEGINVDELLMAVFKLIKLFFMLYILRWELKSIDENFDRLGYDFKMFGFFDNAVTAVTGIFRNKTGIDINDKDSNNG